MVTQEQIERLHSATQYIVNDAIGKLNTEKGHSPCTEACDCPGVIRVVEDHLLHAQKALDDFKPEDAGVLSTVDESDEDGPENPNAETEGAEDAGEPSETGSGESEAG